MATETPSQGRPYRAIVYIFLDGGADTYNLVVPTGGCTGGEGTDLWAQWASQRGENVIPANTLLSITADTQTQPCRRAFCPIVRHPRRTLHRLHSILAGAPTV